MADSPLKNTDGPIGIELKLSGAPAPDTLSISIARVQVDSDLGQIPSARVLVILNGIESGDIDDDWWKIGTDAEVLAFYGSGTPTQLFEGVVAGARLIIDSAIGPQVELICHAQAETLKGRDGPRWMASASDSDVIASVIESAGLRADVAPTQDTPRDQLFGAVSAWSLIQRLAARHGFVIAVNGDTLRIGPPDPKNTPMLTLTYGADILALDTKLDVTQVKSGASVHAWDPDQQSVTTGASTELTSPTFGSTSAQHLADVFGPREERIDLGAVRPESELTTRAAAQLKATNMSALSGTVRYPGSGKAGPGDTLEIKTGSSHFSGQAIVSGVSHHLESGTWETTARLGLPLPHPVPAAAAPMSGLQIGVVTQLSEDPACGQRIRVRVPLLGDDTETEIWARFAAPYASKDAGFQFLPEIGDEVVIGFLAEDPDAPVILGALHNAHAMRPTEATEENTIKKIRTRSGLELAFDEDKNSVTLETPSGHKITLDDDTQSLTMEDSNGSSVTMERDGITLDAKGDLTLKATGKISIEAGGDANLKGGNVTCEADMAVTAKGGASAELSAGGQTTVKGSIVTIN